MSLSLFDEITDDDVTQEDIADLKIDFDQDKNDTLDIMWIKFVTILSRMVYLQNVPVEVFSGETFITDI